MEFDEALVNICRFDFKKAATKLAWRLRNMHAPICTYLIFTNEFCEQTNN